MQAEERARRLRVTKGARAILRGQLSLADDGAVQLSTVVGAPWKLADKKLAERARAVIRAGEVCDVELRLTWKSNPEGQRYPRWQVKLLGTPKVLGSVEAVQLDVMEREPGSDG